jgi:neutral ceramidase
MKEGTIPPNPFGQQTDRVQMNPPRESPNLIEPAGPTDPQVGVLAVRSSEGRPIAVLANYGLHYIGDVRPGHISADYFGVFADRIQALLDADRQDPPFVGMLTNGTSGDVNNINFRLAAPARQAYERSRTVAGDVAGEAARVIGDATYRSEVVLNAQSAEITLGVRRPSSEELEQAKAILAAASPGTLQKREEVFANETVKLADYPPQVQVPLQVIRIGEAALVAIPCEVFAEIGLEIKEKSPFKQTMVVSLANGYNGYLPTPAQHALGGYETWRARSSYLEVDAAPKIMEQVTMLLESVKGM